MPFKIIYTADLHGNEIYYEKLFKKAKESEIKAVVLGGDLCPRGGNSLQEWISMQKEFLENYFIPKILETKKEFYVMVGNDDFRINFKILEKAEEQGKLKVIHKKCHKIGSRHRIGYSFVNPTPFRLRDWEKFEDNKKEEPQRFSGEIIRSIEEEKGTIESDLKEIRKLSNPNATIYVTHAPPFNTKLDIVASGIHVGSKAIRAFIEKEQPLITLHGHIHESPKMSGSYIDKIGKTACINLGSSYPKPLLNALILDLTSLDIKYIEM